MRTVALLLILFAGGCSSPSRDPGKLSADASARPSGTTFRRLEDTLAKRLLDDAWQEVDNISADSRLENAIAGRDRLERSVNLSLLSPEVRLLVLRYSSIVDDLMLEASPSTAVDNRQMPAPEWSQQAVFEAGVAELDQLAERIEARTGSPVSAAINASRTLPDNYLPDSEEGRQHYLDLVQRIIETSDTGLKLQALAILGVHDDESPLFDYQDNTFIINLQHMSRLPLDEIRVQAGFHTIPGLHAAATFDLRGLSPTDIEGWAAYVGCRSCRSATFDVRDLIHSRNLAALMVAESAMGGLGWSSAAAIDYLSRESSYTLERIRAHVARMATSMNISSPRWRSRTLGRLLIQREVERGPAAMADHLIAEYGPQTLSTLRQLLSSCADRTAIQNSAGPAEDPVPVGCPDTPSR